MICAFLQRIKSSNLPRSGSLFDSRYSIDHDLEDLGLLIKKRLRTLALEDFSRGQISIKSLHLQSRPASNPPKCF